MRIYAHALSSLSLRQNNGHYFVPITCLILFSFDIDNIGRCKLDEEFYHSPSSIAAGGDIWVFKFNSSFLKIPNYADFFLHMNYADTKNETYNKSHTWYIKYLIWWLCKDIFIFSVPKSSLVC